MSDFPMPFLVCLALTGGFCLLCGVGLLFIGGVMATVVGVALGAVGASSLWLFVQASLDGHRR